MINNDVDDISSGENLQKEEEQIYEEGIINEYESLYESGLLYNDTSLIL